VTVVQALCHKTIVRYNFRTFIALSWNSLALLLEATKSRAFCSADDTSALAAFLGAAFPVLFPFSPRK
jgi:hypothetical protein